MRRQHTRLECGRWGAECEGCFIKRMLSGSIGRILAAGITWTHG